MNNYPNRRRQGPRYPHFDSRGPDYYYDAGPPPGPDDDLIPHPEDFRGHNRDAYNDEFIEPGYDGFRPDRNGPWPEDNFYEHRRNLEQDHGYQHPYDQPPHPWWNRRRYNDHRPFPEDQPQRRYYRQRW